MSFESTPAVYAVAFMAAVFVILLSAIRISHFSWRHDKYGRAMTGLWVVEFEGSDGIKYPPIFDLTASSGSIKGTTNYVGANEDLVFEDRLSKKVMGDYTRRVWGSYLGSKVKLFCGKNLHIELSLNFSEDGHHRLDGILSGDERGTFILVRKGIPLGDGGDGYIVTGVLNQ